MYKRQVTLHVRDIPYTEYAANVSRKKPLYTSYWSGSATLFDAIHRIYHSKSQYNYSKIESAPGLDAKLDAMIAEVDLDRRKAITADVLRTLHASADRLIPYFRNYLGISTEKVQGFVPPRFGTVEMRGIWLSALTGDDHPRLHPAARCHAGVGADGGVAGDLRHRQRAAG